ncbi:M48 family metalloprotease [Streptomyces sp. NPDC026665]|uniref:M48 family metalloprotease n=1 Tax=Streptomyces sp. NPDC026665 TaxID=3154798 RepID=UPI0033F4E962
MTRPPPGRPARSWGPPPWLWLTLALFLAQLPELVGDTLDVSTGLGRLDEAGRGPFVTAVLSLVQLLPQYFLLAAVLALLAPRARCRLVERRFGLLAFDDPLMAPPAVAPGSRGEGAEPHFATAMAAFVHEHAPGTRLRLSTQDGISARVYPGGWRIARIGVFAPLVHLWHTDIEAARAVLLHELGHLRRGEQHVTGLGSPFTALVRVWPYVLAGFVVLPVALLVVTGNATAVLVFAEVVLVLESVPKVLLLVVAALWSAELGADRFAARTAGADTVVRALRRLEKGDHGGLARLYHPPVRMRVRCVARAGTTGVQLLSVLLWPLALVAQLLLTMLGAFPAYVLLGAPGDRAARQVLALAHESLAAQPTWWATLAAALVWPLVTGARPARRDPSTTPGPVTRPGSVGSGSVGPGSAGLGSVRPGSAGSGSVGPVPAGSVSFRSGSAGPGSAGPVSSRPAPVRPPSARPVTVYVAAVLLPAVVLFVGLLPLASRPDGGVFAEDAVGPTAPATRVPGGGTGTDAGAGTGTDDGSGTGAGATATACPRRAAPGDPSRPPGLPAFTAGEPSPGGTPDHSRGPRTFRTLAVTSADPLSGTRAQAQEVADRLRAARWTLQDDGTLTADLAEVPVLRTTSADGTTRLLTGERTRRTDVSATTTWMEARLVTGAGATLRLDLVRAVTGATQAVVDCQEFTSTSTTAQRLSLTLGNG